MKLKKTLSFWDVFSIALGQVIGSGIMVLIGIGIEFTAYAVPFAFILSATLSLIKRMPVVSFVLGRFGPHYVYVQSCSY